MSFVKTLATLAVGFAAARGVDTFRKMGGVAGMKEALRGAAEPGGVADKMGVPGGGQAMRDLVSKMSAQAVSTTEATEAGLDSLLGAMSAAAASGAKGVGDMLQAVSAATPAHALMEENAKLMIRAMIQAAKADGEIDAEERARIMDHLGDASDEELAFVNAALDAPVDVAALASEVGAHAKAQVYSAALMAITVDTPAEKQYLANLAAALGLEASKVLEIHNTMGKPAP